MMIDLTQVVGGGDAHIKSLVVVGVGGDQLFHDGAHFGRGRLFAELDAAVDTPESVTFVSGLGQSDKF